MDSLVSSRRAVSICADCERKYGDWHIRHNYVKRETEEVTDCDGCGTFGFCAGFFPSLV